MKRVYLLATALVVSSGAVVAMAFAQPNFPLAGSWTCDVSRPGKADHATIMLNIRRNGYAEIGATYRLDAGKSDTLLRFQHGQNMRIDGQDLFIDPVGDVEFKEAKRKGRDMNAFEKDFFKANAIMLRERYQLTELSAERYAYTGTGSYTACKRTA